MHYLNRYNCGWPYILFQRIGKWQIWPGGIIISEGRLFGKVSIMMIGWLTKAVISLEQIVVPKSKMLNTWIHAMFLPFTFFTILHASKKRVINVFLICGLVSPSQAEAWPHPPTTLPLHMGAGHTYRVTGYQVGRVYWGGVGEGWGFCKVGSGKVILWRCA